MRVETTNLPDVLLLVPVPHRDDRGFFTRTFDTVVFDDAARQHGLDVRADQFTQDSQSRSRPGVLRGLHGRIGRGEAKLVRCARGSVLDVLVDARRDSPAFGRHQTFVLDDVDHAHLFVPAGFLHGFVVTSGSDADVCYRIDRPHDPSEDVSVAFDDPDLAVAWPSGSFDVSDRDRGAGSWADLTARLQQ